jgi:hypothetical protein
MSPSVGNFVHDLVEMAKAMETLPQVQHQLDAALKANADLLDRIQSLEIRLLDRASEIDALHAKIREAEQARDQAETMFLEETDRTASFKSFVENLFGTAGNLLKAASPPAPLAVPEVEQVHEAAPTTEIAPAQERHDMFPEPEYYISGSPENIDSQSSGPAEGQSAADPTANRHGSPASPITASSETVGSQEPVSTVEPQPGPYTGKWYSDRPELISLSDWLAGGGTEERYWGRPPTAQGVG